MMERYQVIWNDKKCMPYISVNYMMKCVTSCFSKRKQTNPNVLWDFFLVILRTISNNVTCPQIRMIAFLISIFHMCDENRVQNEINHSEWWILFLLLLSFVAFAFLVDITCVCSPWVLLKFFCFAFYFRFGLAIVFLLLPFN